jgi:hypothetical protein
MSSVSPQSGAATSPPPLRIKNIEHGVAIPAGAPDRNPQARPTVDALGLRMMYYGWPGLTTTTQGDLLLSACEQVLHVTPYGREVIARSSDGGRTWPQPQVMYDSVTDDRDIALNRMPDGVIIATWFSSDIWARPRPFPWMRPEWEPLRDTIKPDTFRALHRGWLRRSTDGGRTWEQLIHPTLVGQHAGPCPLHNGDLLYLGRYPLEDGNQMVATLSRDGGRTWSILAELPVPRFYEEISKKRWSELGENHALEVAPGRIVAAFRAAPDAHMPNVYVATSADSGRTWTPARDTGLFGHPPFLLKLHSGVLLCLTSQRGNPQRIVAMASYDLGQTWDLNNLLVLTERHGTEGLDMGYPVAVETAPNEIFCVYYSSPTPRSPHYQSEDPQQHGIRSIRIQLG